MNNTALVQTDPSYDEFVDGLAKNSHDLTFKNYSEEHELSILKAIFNHSKNHISLFYDDMDARIFGNKTLIRAARAFLELDYSKLFIVVRNHTFTADHCEFTKQLLGEFGYKIDIRKTSINSRVDEMPLNFIIADNHIYRLEDDIDNKTATGSFNDRETTAILQGLFLDIFSDSSVNEVVTNSQLN